MDILEFKPYDTNIYHYLSLIIDKYKDIDYTIEGNDPFDALTKLIHLRHDIIHLFLEAIATNSIMKPKYSALEYSLMRSLSGSKQIMDMFKTGDLDEDERSFRLTPDMMIVRELEKPNSSWRLLKDIGLGQKQFQDIQNVREIAMGMEIILIDVSVSTARNKSYAEKIAKYSHLTRMLGMVFAKSKVQVFNTSVSLSNLNQKLEDFSNDIDLRFDTQSTYMAIATLIDSLETTISHVKQQIGDSKAINFFMSRQYGDNEGLSYNDYKSINRTSNLEDIQEMYSAHMLTCNDEERSRIDDMDEEMTTMTDDDVAKKMKECLESGLVDDVMEKRSESGIIKEELDKIDSRLNSTITSKVKPSVHAFSPLTTNVISDVMSAIQCSKDDTDGLEQRQIYTLLTLFSSIKTSGNDFMTGVSDLCETLLEPFKGEFREYNRYMFNEGLILNEEVDKAIQESYNNYKAGSKQKKQGNDSKMTYIHGLINGDRDTITISKSILKEITDKIPKEEAVRSTRPKMIRIEAQNSSKLAKEMIKMNQSGIKVIREQKPYNQLSVDRMKYKDVDDYLDYLSNKDNLPEGIRKDLKKKKADDFLRQTIKRYSNTDPEIIRQFKNENTEDINKVYKIIREYPSYWYAFNQFLIAEQLCHFTQFTLPTNTYSLFTAGSSNTCFLLQNSYHDSGKDVGKAFLSFGYTDRPEEINSIYGTIYTHKREIMGKEYIFFCTNWRRITSTKTTFTRDQFYSTLSTGSTALLRCIDDLKLEHAVKGVNATLRHHYTLKAFVGYVTNQRTAELLADMRYAIMSSFSEFSRIDKFIADKFKPPFRTSFDIWIYTRLRNIERFVENIDLHRSNMIFRQPKFVNGRRTEESLGGQVMIPSIWDNYTITELQDVLDDLFLYVHTIKEPSSIHYENVKSINTILKFQRMYNNMSHDRKIGNVLNDKHDIADFINDKNIIGHSKDIVNLSAKFSMSTMNESLISDMFTEVLNEPLSNITSTKASIPEYERKTVLQKASRKKISMIRDRIEEMASQNNEDIDADQIIRKILTSSSEIKRREKIYKTKSQGDNAPKYLERDYNECYVEFMGQGVERDVIRALSKQVSVIPSDSHLPGGIRAKVHDCLLDFLIRNPDTNTVLDLAKWNVVHNKSLVHADICIKAQYGAKREFYVINIGAKAQARLLEEFFHKICN
jgi:hypothetical protein